MIPHAGVHLQVKRALYPHDTTLPDSFPGEFADSVLDTLDVELFGEPSRIILLRGEDGKAAVVSASVSGPGARPEGTGGQWMRLRAILASYDPALSALSARATKALGLINWHHTSRFCGRCGSAMEDHPSDCARICPACKTPIYPRISPA
jgi:NADH pyrophosphatase NudC (nudix superfamily)